MNEFPAQTEVLAKLRFNKHNHSGDQPSLQNFRAVGGTVDSNSRGFMSHGVNAQRDLSYSSNGMSPLVLGLFAFKLKTFRWQHEAQFSKVAEFCVRSWADE